jgi:diguanylate cyclase (GGDEF)-like protein
LHLLAGYDDGVNLSLYALEVAAYVILIIISEALDWLKSRPGQQAMVSSLCMVVFIYVVDMTVTAPAIAMLLLIPVINAALRTSYRATLVMTLFIGLAAALLRSLEHDDLNFGLYALLADLLPLLLVAVVVKTLSADVVSARNRITALSYQDELTGLLNMRAFTRLMQSEHQKAEINRSSYAMLMIDVQELQAVNDRYGHEQGNRALIAVADALKRSIRSIDFVARYGGDEFLIFVSGADKAAAQEVYNRVNQNVYNITLSFERTMQRLQVNVGIATFPDNGTTIQQLISFAARSMHRDKAFLRKTSQPERDPGASRSQAGVESWD